MWNIRPLRADEIEVRAQKVNANGFSVLLYKNARADMNVLDETFGPSNWQRRHLVVKNNLFCSVLIWDDEKKEWIEKQDVGKPSNAEAEKGEASDSFKRACTNIGIGRELYTAPFIWIRALKDEIDSSSGKPRLSYKVKIHVHRIEYSEKKISFLQLADEAGNIRFTYPQGSGGNAPQESQTQNQGQHNTQQGQDRQRVLDEIVDFVNAKKIPPQTVSEMVHQKFKKQSTDELNIGELKALLNALRQAYGSK